MSIPPNSYYFRRRTIGRAASPPTWACYEQIPYDDDDYSDSCSDSCSEDDDEYPRSAAIRDDPISSDTDDKDDEDEDGDEDGDDGGPRNSGAADDSSRDMEIDGVDRGADPELAGRHNKAVSGDPPKDAKGKQKAADPEPEDRRRSRKKHHRPVYTLRPILTIHKSQGFVWNQDLFVPPYIKDRYVASTSPPNSKGFISSSTLSTSSGLGIPDYEVEVVEIRVKEGDLDGIIP